MCLSSVTRLLAARISTSVSNQAQTSLLVLYFKFNFSLSIRKAQPLASGFSLRDGSVYVTCPTVTPGNNYIVVRKYVPQSTCPFISSHPVFGDSGNASPQFTISGPSTDDDSAASQVTQPSSTELTPSPPVSTTSSTSSVPEPSSGSLAPALTTSPAVPQDDSSPTGYTSLSASPSQESTSSSTSTVNPTPLAGLNTNVAISRIQKPGAMVACAIFSVFMTFLL